MSFHFLLISLNEFGTRDKMRDLPGQNHPYLDNA